MLPRAAGSASSRVIPPHPPSHAPSAKRAQTSCMPRAATTCCASAAAGERRPHHRPCGRPACTQPSPSRSPTRTTAAAAGLQPAGIAIARGLPSPPLPGGENANHTSLLRQKLLAACPPACPPVCTRVIARPAWRAMHRSSPLVASTLSVHACMHAGGRPMRHARRCLQEMRWGLGSRLRRCAACCGLVPVPALGCVAAGVVRRPPRPACCAVTAMWCGATAGVGRLVRAQREAGEGRQGPCLAPQPLSPLPRLACRSTQVQAGAGLLGLAPPPAPPASP